MSQLKILVITQKVDQKDAILGFFCGWLNALAKRLDRLYVLTLERGNADLPKNTELYSLAAKERESNRLVRLIKLGYLLAKIISKEKIDLVFIHMCPEYVFLAYPFTKIAKVPLVMWYAHSQVNGRLKLAHLLVDKIITPSRESFRVQNKKTIITGHGIDVGKFKAQNSEFEINDGRKKIILSVGRLSPIKDYPTLIRAADILINQRHIKDIRFQIVGGVPVKSQNRYFNFLKNLVKSHNLEDYVEFTGEVSYACIEDYYQNCDLLVSTSNTGSLDKAVLEAMACQKLVLTSNEAFTDLLKNYSPILLFDKNNPHSLAEKITSILEMDRNSRGSLTMNLREIVARNHNLNQLMDNLLSVFQYTMNHN